MVDEKRHEEIEGIEEEEHGSDHKNLKSIMKPPLVGIPFISRSR